MKVILTMAISLNGLIADLAGEEDFLPAQNWGQFVALARKVGVFVWGRKTYEKVMTWEEDYLQDLLGVRKVILSQTKIALAPGFEWAVSPTAACQMVAATGGQELIVTGGAEVNRAFAQAGLLDEIYLDLNPVILGRGIPLFQPADFQLDLKLLDFRQIGAEIIELHYQVGGKRKTP